MIVNSIRSYYSPNPAHLKTLIQISLAKTSQVSIQLTTQSGNLLFFRKSKVLQSGQYNYPLELNGLPAGTYNVHLVINGNISVTKQLIKL